MEAMSNNTVKDLTKLSWTKTRESSGTAGSYLKSFSYQNGKKVYYKLSYFDPQNDLFGYESINEIIANRLMEQLGYNCLKYYIVNGKIIVNSKEYITPLVYSYDFKGPNDSKITFENFYELNKKENETIIDFAKRNNFENELYHMIVIDYLIVNRDRHGANLEVIYNSKTKQYRIAPLFDQGLSFVSPAYLESDVKAFNVLENRKVNSFLGQNDLDELIKLVPKSVYSSIQIDFDAIFNGLEAFTPKYYLDKCKELLIYRIKKIESI